MEPLPTTKKVLIWLSMHPNDAESLRKWERLARFMVSWMIFTFFLCTTTALFKFVTKFISTNLEDSLFSLMGFINCFGTVIIMMIAFVLRHQLPIMFEKLKAIYDTNENMDSAGFLTRANGICEWMWTIYLKFAISFLFSLILSSIASILFSWLMNGHLDVNNFYRPIGMILPWDQSTGWGYFAEICFIYSISELFSFVNIGVLLMLYISMCIHHRAFYDTFNYSIEKWNHSRDIRHDGKFICSLIRFHVSVKEWFLQSAKIYSPFIFVQLINSATLLATSMFQLDVQFQNHNYIALANLLFLLLLGMAVIFPYCYFGKLATDSFQQMSDCVYEMDWRKLPIQLQKNVILMIENMQRPIYYHGLDVAKLDLNTYVRLIKSIFSYYLMFKTITA